MTLEMTDEKFETTIEKLFLNKKYKDISRYFDIIFNNNDNQKLKIILSSMIKYDVTSEYIDDIFKILLKNDAIYRKEPISIMSINDFLSKNRNIINYELYIKYLKKLLDSEKETIIPYGFALLNILINYKNEIFKNNIDDIRNYLLLRFNDNLGYRIKSNILYNLCHYMCNKEIIEFIRKNLLEREDETNQRLFFESYSTLFNDNSINFEKYIHIAIENKNFLEIYLFYILKDIEKYINSNQNENNYILYEVFQLFTNNLNFFFNPTIRKHLSSLKFNTYWNTNCPMTIYLINEILKDKNYKIPHYGWYYNLYKQYEKELIKILYYIPLIEPFDKENYKFGSPAIVDLHIKIGTRLDSTLNSYLENYSEQIKITHKTKKFNENIKLLKQYIPFNQIKITMRDYGMSFTPFDFSNKNPEWYSIYSGKKHDLIKMENNTNLLYLIESLAALYALVIYHPENWNSIEYDWDSEIFDKYSIQPKILLEKPE